MMSLKTLASALGGEVLSGGVSAPGPGHGKRDRSLRIFIHPTAPNGFSTHSFANDDPRACRDHVKANLGIVNQVGSPSRKGGRLPTPAPPPPEDPPHRSKTPLRLWNRAESAQASTLVKTYLASRGLKLPPCADEVLRFDPEHPFTLENGTTIRLPAMLALFRDIVSNRPVAIHRTALNSDGSGKAADVPGLANPRKMLGPAKGAAIKLDDDASVELGLTIGEGIETCLAAWQLGFQPCWAAGSSGAIEAFPILSGIEALTLLCEDDANGANARAVARCADRWLAANREVLTVKPIYGGDANDALKRLERG